VLWKYCFFIPLFFTKFQLSFQVSLFLISFYLGFEVIFFVIIGLIPSSLLFGLILFSYFIHDVTREIIFINYVEISEILCNV
jgi:hypothetical protein